MERKSKFILNLKKGAAALFGAAFTVLALSCEIGLGAAVDTEKPKLEITYPPKGAVIMDTFVLAGTVSDDTGLDYIKVTLTNKDLKTTYTYSSKDGQVEFVDPGKNWRKGTTWTAKIGKKTEGRTLYNGWDLPDGEYFIDVEACDGYGSVYDRRSVTIDNTPPVFIVENLISIEGNTEDASVFGHRINLQGQAKDESDLSKVFFTAYDSNKQEIFSSELNYSMTSEGIVLARYSNRMPEDETEKVLAENFNKIYGIAGFDSPEITEIKDFYLTAKISDSARKYVAPVYEHLSEEEESKLGTGEGNLTTEMFLKTQEFKQAGISIDELKEYKKHLKDDEGFDSILANLQSTSIASVNASGNFENVTKLNINPKLQPFWYINNFDKKAGSPFETLYVGSPLTFNFEWGNNKEKFRPSNIRVVLARLNTTADEKYTTVLTEEQIENATVSTEDAIILINNGNTSPWSSDLTETFTKSVTLKSDLIRTPSSYRIFVFGHDGSGSTGQKFEEKDNNVYGFKARKNTQVPKIKFLAADNVKDADGVELPKSGSGIGPGMDKIPFWFKVLTDGERLEKLPEIEVKVGGIKSVLDTPQSYFNLVKDPSELPENPGKEMDGDKEKYSYLFKWSLVKGAKPLPTKEDSPEWNDEFDFDITVNVTDLGGGESKSDIYFELDNKEPEVSIGEITSPDMEVTGNKLNGTVKIPVSFTDNNPKLDETTGKNLAAYTVYNAETNAECTSGTVENEKEINLNTAELPANIILKVISKDRFGNTGKAEKTYAVDQSTDKPVLTFNNLTQGIVNTFGVKTNNVIETAVKDDDSGFGKIEVRVRDFDAADWADDSWKTINSGKTTANWNFTKALENSAALITNDGKYKIQFRATDSVGLATGIVESAVYDIIADSTKPVFGTEVVTNGELVGAEYFVKKDATASIALEITEANLKKVTVNGNVIEFTPVQGADDKSKVTYNWIPGTQASGVYELEFIATDESENTNSKSVTLHYVKDLPVFGDVEVTPEVLAGNKVNGVISYKGNVDQTRNDTKIKKISLELKQGATVLDTKTVEDTANFEWTNINTNGFTDLSALDLVMTATDIAGNTDSKTYTVNIDQSTDTPVLKINNLIPVVQNAFGLTENNVIEISVTDDDPGFGKIEVRAKAADAANWPDENWYTIASGKTSANWNFTEALEDSAALITADGKYNVQFRAKDSAGLSTGVRVSDIYNIIADSTKPVLGTKTVTNGVLYNSEYYVKKDTAAKVSLEVTEVNLKEVTVNGNPITFAAVDGQEGKYTASYNWVPGTQSSGQYDLVFSAKDMSGNTSDSKTVTIHYVKNLPVISNIEVTGVDDKLLAENKVNGVISLKGNVEHDAKITSVLLELKQGATLLDSKTVNDITSFEWTDIDTTAAGFADNTPLSLYVTATDIAGNYNYPPKVFTVNVDQSTDTPKLTLENLKAGENAFGRTSNNEITMSATDDDDGFGKFEVRVRGEGSSAWADNTTGWNVINTGSTSATWNFYNNGTGLITSDGKYKVQFRATDSKGKAAGVKISDEYDLIADSTNPVLGAETVTNGKLHNSEYYVKKGTTATVTLEVTEVNLKEVTVNGNSVPFTPVTGQTGKYSVSYDWVPGSQDSGSYELKFNAKDKSGNEAAVQKTVKIHYVKELPVITDIEITPTVLAGNKVNGIISYSGKIEHTVEIEKFILELKQGSTSVITPVEVTDGSTVISLININTTGAGFTDNTDLTLYVTATDIAGNHNDPEEYKYTVTVDQSTDKPVIKFDTDKIDSTWTSFANVENINTNPGSKKNLLGINDNNSFEIYVTDDDAVKEITVQAYVGDTSTAVAAAKTFAGTDLDGENKVVCKLEDLGITAAGNYKIVVNATDDESKTGLTSANSAITKNVYIVVDGVAPDITDIKVDDKAYTGPAYINGTKKNVTFKVTEMHLSSVTVDGGDPLTLGTPDNTSGPNVYSFTYEYAPSRANKVIAIVAKDSTGLSSSREITINHDKEEPVINTPTVTPTVFNKGKTVNEKITITGTVSDESGYPGVAGKVNDSDLVVKLQRCDNDVWTDIDIPSEKFSLRNQKYTITDFDTATLKNSDGTAFRGKIRVYVKATDRAGNSSETAADDFENADKFVYDVDQDSDLPTLKFTNVDAETTVYKDNLFGFGKWKINGTVKDDDGAVKLYYKNTSGNYVEVTGLSGIDNNNEQSFSFEVPHSNGETGDKEVEFLCVDKNGLSDSVTSKKTTKTIKYAIDDQKPEFTARSLNGKAYETGLFAGATRTITLEVSDDNGIAIAKDEETDENKSYIEYYTAEGTWTKLFVDSDGKYKHEITDSTNGDVTNKYRVTDVYGRETETELTYTVDTEAPDGTAEIKVEGADYVPGKWLGSGSVTISISGITDENLKDTVSYAVTGKSTGSGNVQISESGVVSNTLAFVDGNSTVTYTYSDEAGNTKPVVVYVNVDTVKPEAEVTAVSGVKQPGTLTLKFSATDDPAAAASEGGVLSQSVSGLAYAYIGTSPTFDLATKSEANGYLKKIELFTTTGEGDSTVETYPVTKKDITTDVKIPKTDGKYQYFVVLEDRAGHTSNYTGFGEFTIDGTNPEVKITKDIKDAEKTSDDDKVIDVNKTIRISGTTEEAHAGSYVPALAIYAADSDGNKTGNAIETTGLFTDVTDPANTFAAWAYDVNTTELTDGKEYVFEVTAADAAGNPGSDSITLKVNQTSDRPVITLENIYTDTDTGKTKTLSDGKIEWTATDDDGTINTMKVKVLRKDGNNWVNDAAVADRDSDGFVEVTVSEGMFTYTVPSHGPENDKTTDGSYKLDFQVTDGKSTPFATKDSTTKALEELRVKTKNGNSVPGNAVEFDVDGTPPVFGTVLVNRVWTEVTNKDSTKTIRYTDTASEFKSSVHYGGPKYRYAKLTIPVSDNVCPEDEITVKVKVGDNDPETVTTYEANKGFIHQIDFRATVTDEDGKTTFKIPSGPVTVRIDAADKSGKEVSKYFNIYVDNLGPDADGKAVQNMTPSVDTEVTAVVSIAANINDDSIANSRVASVKYYVPKNNGIAAGQDGSVVETTPSETTPWSTTDLTFSDVVMKLELNGLATSEGFIAANYAGHTQTAPNSGVYFLPVWFRLEDNCGNISYVKKRIRYNPDAVRPRIKRTFPVHNPELVVGEGDSAKNYVVLGGTILLAGSAEDNVAVDAIYVQYDINGDGNYSKSDVAYLINNGYTVVKIEDGTPVSYTGTPGSDNIVVTDSIFAGDATNDKWGIKADGTGSWNTEFAASGLTGLEINGKDEENKPTNPNNKTLNIRMCARDKDTPTAHTSAWTDELHVSVNNSVPQFGKFYLVQYTDAEYGTEYKRVPYENGMFIKGTNWRLEGTVVDNDGISSVKAGPTEIDKKVAYKDSVTNYSGFTVKQPVTPDPYGKFSVTLTATDTAESGQGITLSQYVVNVDNIAPAFKDGADDDTLVLYKGDYGREVLDSDNKLQNSNGWTTIASKVTEAGSGFARAVFYVERYSSKTIDSETGDTSYTNRRFYNVMERENNRIDMDEDGTAVSGAPTLNEDNLPVVTKEITKGSDNYSFTVTELNNHIRVGGLVIIGNVYKTITAIDGTTITVSEKIESAWPNNKQNAQFVYAFVVDHTGESLNSDNGIKNDDDDGIVESYTKSANDYTWDAAFDSSKIPDGPLDIHVVVFDVAGNSRHGIITTRAANNAPRITSVKIGTDLNFKNGIQDTTTYSEYTQFYAITNSHGEADTTQGMEIWNLVPSQEIQSKDRDWVIKKDLSLKPEFVGGKAPFYYVFSKAEGTGDSKRLTTPEAGTSLSSATAASGVQGKFAEHGALTVENDDLKLDNPTSEADCENQVNTYRFSFWDSTEESTVGGNTGWCILNVELKQDLEDTDKPRAHVYPFFWKGRGDGNNSVAWDATNKPLGHIELERDLTTGANGITGTTVNGTALGTDPKVSGTIVIRGTAYDDTRLSKVIVTYEGIIDGTTNKCEASYNGSGWPDNSTKDKGYSLSVTDLNGGVTQNGHLVEWALTIDTSKVKTGSGDSAVKETGLDKKVVVKAVDAASETAASTNLESDAPASGASTTTANLYYYATEAQAALGKYYAAEDKALLHKADYKTSTGDNQTEIFDRVVELVGVKTAATSSDPAVNEYKVYGNNSQYQMDIVPYVTEVVTNLSSGKVTNPSVYNRTANGHYPVQSVVKNVESGKMTNTASEDIVLRGFNLGGTVSVAAASTTNNTALSRSTIAANKATGLKNEGELCFNASTLKSGRPVITVNSIPLMNNLNSNSARGECTADKDEKDYDNCYNRTPNYENNNLLTDDIEFDVWEFNDTIVKAANNQFISGFAMQINQNNKKIQYAFAAGDRRFYSAKDENNSTSAIERQKEDYILPSSIGFHVNEAGSKWYSTYLNAAEDVPFRIVNNGTESAITGNLNGSNAGIKDLRKSSVFASRTTTSGETTTVHTYHAFFNKYDQTIELKTGTNGSITGTESEIIVKSGNAGEYVSIAVTPDTTTTANDTLCVVWANQIGKKVQYMFKTNAAETDGTWSDPEDIFTGVAQHCQIAADAHGGIHIAAYINGSLKYAYAPNYSSAFTTCTVDSGNTGNNLTLDVALVNVASSGATAVYRPVPVIGYYSGVGQRPKYAKLNESVWNGGSVTETGWTPEDGMTADKFTGNWEVNYVPVLKPQAFDAEEKIYVGLWKHRYNETNVQSGSITTSSSSNSTYDSSKTALDCNTYGNGTSNAVLCYIADNGKRIESAQMR